MVMKHFLAQRKLNVTFEGGIGSFLLTCMLVHHLQMMRADTSVQLEAIQDVRWAPHAIGRERIAAAAAAALSSDADPFAGRHSREQRPGRRRTSGSAASRAWSHETRVGGLPASIAGDSVGHAPATLSREDRVAVFPRGALNLGYLLFTFLEYFGRRFDYRNDCIVIAPEPGLVRKSVIGFINPRNPRSLALESPVDASWDIGRNSYGIQGAQAAMFTAFLALARSLEDASPVADLQSKSPGRSPFGRHNQQVRRPRQRPAPQGSHLAAVLAIDGRLRDRAETLCAALAPEPAAPTSGAQATPATSTAAAMSSLSASASGELAASASAAAAGTGRVSGSPLSSACSAAKKRGRRGSAQDASEARAATQQIADECSAETGSFDAESDAISPSSAEVSSTPAAAAPAAAASAGASSPAVNPPAAAATASLTRPDEARSVSQALGVVASSAAAASPALAQPSMQGLLSKMRRPRLIADLLSGRREREVDPATTAGSWF